MITWDSMMFFIYIFGIIMCAYLLRKPPDWFQVLVLLWGIMGMLILVLYHGLEAFSIYEAPLEVRSQGLAACTMGFVFHVARQVLKKMGVFKCQNSLLQYHSSQALLKRAE